MWWSVGRKTRQLSSVSEVGTHAHTSRWMCCYLTNEKECPLWHQRGPGTALCSKANFVDGEQRSKELGSSLTWWRRWLLLDKKVKESESNINWDPEESLWITETFADINVYEWPANICGTAAPFCRRSSVIITAQGHYSHQDADQVPLYASLICKLAISTSCLPIQMFALFNQQRRSRPSESWCGKLVKVRAAVAAACWITPTGLGEDPFYTSGAATRVQELDLIYFSPGATVSPLFSTHPEKGPRSRSSRVQHTLGSKILRYLQTRLTISKKRSFFTDTHLTLTITSFSPLCLGFHTTSKHPEYYPD